MPEDRDTRVETLREGDQLRYYGDWFDVVAVQTIDSRRHPQIAVTIDEMAAPAVEMVNLRGESIVHQPYRTVLFPPGHFVAAECQVRP